MLFFCLQGTDFLLNVFAAAVVSWADHCAPLLVGITAQWFPWRQSFQVTEMVTDQSYVSPASTELSVASCLIGIPSSIKELLAKEPWKSQLQKVCFVLRSLQLKTFIHFNISLF